MSSLIHPIFHKNYALEFEEYREDHILENQLKKIIALRNNHPANIKLQEFQEVFTTCLNHCKENNFRMGYRLIAFAALGGINEYADLPGKCESALLYAIHDKRSNLQMINELIVATLKERISSIDSVVRRIEKIRKMNIDLSEEIAQGSGEDWVPFSHGGGFQSIYHFFILQNWKGYKSDGFIDGFWVTPAGSGYERDFYYSYRTPPKHFDTPCVIKGEIQRKHLVSCPNSYEAKIAFSNVDKIKNITFQAFPEQIVNSYPYFPVLLYVSLKDRVSKETEENFFTLFKEADIV